MTTTPASIFSSRLTALAAAMLWLLASPAVHATPTLFVQSSTSFGTYNATTGAAISPVLINGLDSDSGIAASGNTLFVAEYGNSRVGEFNATTGATLNDSFADGLTYPEGLALAGGSLYVCNYIPHTNNSTVAKYNATTGAVVSTSFIGGLNDPADVVVAGNAGYVGDALAGVCTTPRRGRPSTPRSSPAFRKRAWWFPALTCSSWTAARAR